MGKAAKIFHQATMPPLGIAPRVTLLAILTGGFWGNQHHEAYCRAMAPAWLFWAQLAGGVLLYLGLHRFFLVPYVLQTPYLLVGPEYSLVYVGLSIAGTCVLLARNRPMVLFHLNYIIGILVAMILSLAFFLALSDPNHGNNPQVLIFVVLVSVCMPVLHTCFGKPPPLCVLFETLVFALALLSSPNLKDLFVNAIAPSQAMCVLAAFHVSYDHLRHNRYVMQQSLLQKEHEKKELRRAAYQQKQMNIQLEERYALQEQLNNELQERYTLQEELNNEQQERNLQQQLKDELQERYVLQEQLKNELQERYALQEQLNNELQARCAQQSLNERLEHQLAAIDSFKVLSRRVRIYMSLTQVCRTGCV